MGDFVVGGGKTNSELVWRNRALVGALVAILIVTSLAALVTASRMTAAATPYRVLRVGVGGLQIQTLNPNAMTLVMEYVVTYNVYSTLLTFDKNYKIKGDLAYDWSVDSDLVNWTFKLVDNAYFANPYAPNDRSHPVTADDIVFSYLMQQNNESSIFNAYTSEIADISKVDTYTVRIQTLEPYAAMLTTAAVIPIFPKYLWESVVDPAADFPAAAPYPLGSGAMYYDAPNVADPTTGPIILKRNPNYYGDKYYCASPRPNEVRLLLYTNMGTMVQDFQSGQSKLDAIVSVDGPSFQKTLPASGTNGFFKWAVAGGFVGEIALNVMTPGTRASNSQFAGGSNNQLLLNDTVRLAVAMSINKSALVKFGLLGLGTVADTLVPPSNWWHYSIPESERYTFDPAAARTLLNSVGWKYDSTGALNPGATPLYQANQQDPLVFRLYTPDTHIEWASMVANMTIWLGQAGIQTTDDRGNYVPGYAIKAGTFMDNAWKTADYDIWLWDWVFTAVSDPSTDVLEVQTTDAIGPTSDNFYSNATFDDLYNQSLTVMDPMARRQVTDTMQKMIYDYHSYILPYYAFDLYAATSRADLGSGWENWGNWARHPGLTPDSDLPNLWFQVYPHDQQPPTVASLSPVQTYTGQPSYFNAVASDAEQGIVNYSWDFGDGATAVTAGGAITHTYAQPGTYQVSVRVSDGEWTSCATTIADIAQNPGGTVNLPPMITSFVASSTSLNTNDSASFTLTVNDTEGDSLYVTWDFGDGSQTSSTFIDGTTVNTQTNQVVAKTHSYSTPGDYVVAVNVSDHQAAQGLSHFLSQSVQVSADWPLAGGVTPTQETNPWISYGIPLAIVAIVILVVAAVVLRRRKTMKEEAREEEGPKEGSPPQAPPP